MDKLLARIRGPRPIVTVWKYPSFEPVVFREPAEGMLNARMRKDILYRQIMYERNSLRAGTAHVKTRGEVRGSGRKIRPQKGTGHARAGDRYAPLFRGGGRAFGKQARSYATELPFKVQAQAFKVALSNLYKQGNLYITTDLILPTWKSAASRMIFLARGWLRPDRYTKTKSAQVLFVHNQDEFGKDTISQAFKNFTLSHQWLRPWCKVVNVRDLMVHDLLKYKRAVIEEGALAHLENTFAYEQTPADKKANYIEKERRNYLRQRQELPRLNIK